MAWELTSGNSYRWVEPGSTTTTQPYTRTSGTTSGAGQPQTQNCPTGYRWDAVQNRCVPQAGTTPSEMTGSTAQNTYQQQLANTQTQTQPSPITMNFGAQTPTAYNASPNDARYIDTVLGTNYSGQTPTAQISPDANGQCPQGMVAVQGQSYPPTPPRCVPDPRLQTSTQYMDAQLGTYTADPGTLLSGIQPQIASTDSGSFAASAPTHNNLTECQYRCQTQSPPQYMTTCLNACYNHYGGVGGVGSGETNSLLNTTGTPTDTGTPSGEFTATPNIPDMPTCLSRCQNDPRGYDTCVRDCYDIAARNGFANRTGYTPYEQYLLDEAERSADYCRRNGGTPILSRTSPNGVECMMPGETPNTPCPNGMTWDAANGGCVFGDRYDVQGERSPREMCYLRNGNWVTNNMLPAGGYCDIPGFNQETTGEWGNTLWDQGIERTGLTPLDASQMQVGQIATPNWQDYFNPNNYTSGLAALTQGVFGGQTLDQLEQQRINAARADIGETYDYASRDLQRDINDFAEQRGLFNSGVAQQLYAKELSDVGRKRDIDINTAIANIRGERPDLLLKEQEAQRQAYQTWGQLDQQAKQQAMSAILGDREQEYRRQFDNGTLNLESFGGNLQLMQLYIDNILSSVNTQADYEETMTKIEQLMQNMNNTDRLGLLNLFF